MKSRSESETLQQPHAHATEPVLEFMEYTSITWPCLCRGQDLDSPFDLGRALHYIFQEIHLPTLSFSIPLVNVFKTKGWVELIFSNRQSACCIIHISSYGKSSFHGLPAFIYEHASPQICPIPVQFLSWFLVSVVFLLSFVSKLFSPQYFLWSLEKESHTNAVLLSQGLQNVSHLAYIVPCIPSALVCAHLACLFGTVYIYEMCVLYKHTGTVKPESVFCILLEWNNFHHKF